MMLYNTGSEAGFYNKHDRKVLYMEFIIEPAKKVPVRASADICVVGGSATGVFAAVRAARLGAEVILIEKAGSLGGTAASGLVCVWHSFFDTTGKKQIIAGLSQEVVERLEKLGSADRDIHGSHFFNPNDMMTELDMLLSENRIKCCLHTFYAGLSAEGDRISHIFIENKDGRSAVKAGFFIDATGDGDLTRDLGIASFRNENIQPPSACFLMQGNADGIGIQDLFRKYGAGNPLKDDWGWSCRVPGLDNITMQAASHVFGRDCSDAAGLSAAEAEGRRQMRDIVKMLREHGRPGENYRIVASCAHIGVRETNHYSTVWQACELPLLLGERYNDAVLSGTYGVDIHHAGRGITFKNFDGTWHTENADGSSVSGNWREELNISPDIPVPTCYQVPFRLLAGETYRNFIAAGRMINADTGAFGALRVMVNLNQLGEAAGVGAYLALHRAVPVYKLDGAEVTKTLRAGGSAL